MKHVLHNTGVRSKWGIGKLTVALLLLLLSSNFSFGQTLYDSFSDGDFTANPTWAGTAAWGIQANSDAAAGATGSNTVRLAAPAVSQTDYLSSQIASWSTDQEWGFFIGRRAQAFTAANQAYFWLYANESTLNNTTVDGYRIAIGDDITGDDIRLEYVVNGVGTTVITGSTALNNGLTDIGLLIRVTRTSAGLWTLYSSTIPTANGTGAIATDIPNSTNASVLLGSATHTLITPSANGYIGIAALHSTGANAIISTEFDQVYFTAGTVSSATLANITQPSTPIVQGTTAVLAGFTVTATTSSDFTAATVSASGNATSTDLNNVIIYRDNNANGIVDGADASVSGSGIAYGNPMTFSISETGITTTRNYLIVADVAGVGVSTVGNDVTLSIASGNFSTTATINTGSMTGAQRIIAAPAPLITVTGTINAFTTFVGTPSTSQSYIVSGSNLSNDITITASNKFEISLNGTLWVDSTGAGITLAQTGGTVANTTIFVRYNPNITGTHAGTISNASSPATTQTINVSGTATASPGPLLYGTVGSTYFQDFDGLPQSGVTTSSGIGAGPFYVGLSPVNASNATGWQYGISALSGDARFATDNGGTGTGSVLSYGSTGSGERALGSLASSGVDRIFGLVVKNTTGQALSNIEITYVGEEWRVGNTTGIPNILQFEYNIGSSDIDTSNVVGVPALNFTSPIGTTVSATALDGNAPANRGVVTATFALNGSWLPNQTLAIRWFDNDDTGTDNGLAIDSFSFKATPAIAPTLQDSNLTFTAITTTSMTAHWVNGNGSGHLVKINTTNSFTDPVDNNGYVANSVYSGSGEQVVYVGSGSSVNVTGLSAGQTYFFRVYGFNGSDASAKYITTTATDNPKSATTTSATPAVELVITSVNGGVDPIFNQPFYVVVQSHDVNGNLQPVVSNTDYQFLTLIGVGNVTGFGTITAGTSIDTAFGVIYDTPDQQVIIYGEVTAGDPLDSGQSAPFNVLDVATDLAFGPTPPAAVVNTIVPSFTVKAARPDGTTDAAFSGPVTIAVNSGPVGGSISGTTTQNTVSGVATFNDITFSLPGSYVLVATTPGLGQGLSQTIVITSAPTMTELVVPQYMGSKSTASANDCRTPFAVCVRIDNLFPSTSYNIIAGLADPAENDTSIGAGNFWNGTNFATTSITGAFTTDANGSSGPYWIYYQPTGNGSRFAPGQSHVIRLAYSTGAFPNPLHSNLKGTKLIKALDIPLNALDPDTANDGAFIKGSSVACAGGKYVLIYDNENGTGDPLSSYMNRQAIPTNTTQAQLPSSINDVYLQSGTSAIGDFAGVIPVGKHNPNGVRRIELRNADNTIFKFATDADGEWPTGAKTDSILRRGVALLNDSDLHFNSVVISSITNTPDVCGGSPDGSASVTATGTGTITYSWNTSPVQTTATATGLTQGTYTVIVSDDATCTSSASTTVGTSGSSATISAGGPTTFCSGGSVTLTAGSGVSYLWSPGGETTQSIVVSTSGSYSVTVDNGAGCVGTSLPETVTVNNFGFNGAFYSENIGIPAGNPLVNAYSGWQNSLPITYSSTTANQPDVRTSNASVGYSGASGAGNIFFTSINDTRNFIISGINTTGYSSVMLTFGLRRDVGSTSDIFTVEYSTNGTTYTPLTITQPPVTNTWYLDTAVGAIPSTTTLSLRFTKSGASAFRLDDVKLSGSTSTPLVNVISGSLNLCPGSSVTLSSNIASGNVWSPNSETTQTITVNTAGSYSVTVTDANGCTSASAPVVVQNVSAPSVTTSVTNLSCNVTNDGTATANVTGGASPYSYSWNTSPVQTTATATGLTAGTYIVTVTDNSGCSATASATINQGSTASTITPSGQTTFCAGGSVTLTAGTGASYLWSPGGETTQSIVVTSSGSYSVTVDDGAGCVQTSLPTTVTVNTFSSTGTIFSENVGSTNGTTVINSYTGWQNSTPILYSSTGTQSDTRTSSTSTGYAGASGGRNVFMGTATTPARDFLISGINTANYSNPVLTFGMHRTDVTNNLTVEVSTDGINYSPLSVVPPPVANVWALATTSGSIPSTPNLYIRFSKNSTTSFRIDDINIEATATSAVITPSGNITLCMGTSVVLTSNVVTQNLWSPNGETTRSITVSTAGAYSLVATDANGCTTASAPVNVQEVSNPTVTVTPTQITCNGAANGSAEAFVTNGLAPYSYSWNTVPVQSNAIASSLAAGNYTVTVTDDNGCTGSASTTITDPPVLVATATLDAPIQCNGGTTTVTVTATGGTGTITGTGTFTVGAGTYGYTVTDANGCTDTDSITVTEPTSISVTATEDAPIVCNGGSTTVTVTATGGTGTLTGTGTFPANAGTHTYTVTDANGCTGTASVTITEPAAVVVSSLVPSTGCPGSAVVINGSNLLSATQVAFNGVNATFTVINDNVINATVPATASTGFVTVTTSAGCTGTSGSVFTVISCGGGLTLNLKAYMQGYYLGGGMMNAVMQNQAVPGATSTQTDTVLIELRNSANPATIVDQSTAVLMTNGTGTFNFTNALPDNYWIVFKHRNSIVTFSAAPVAIPGSYDFTTAATQAFGDNMIDAVNDGVYSMYTGDVNNDDFIDIFDFPDYDLDNQNFVAFEYKKTDFNGDGFVDIFDFPIYDANNQNFIFSIQP